MKTIIKIALLLFCTQQVMAQQEGVVSQYMFNGLFINPAYAGSHKYFSTSLLYRKQWVGFEGSPESIIAAVDGPIQNENMGIGLIIARDKIGVTNESSFLANYSYNIKLGSGKLAFGIKAGASYYEAALTELTYWDEEDPVYSGNIQSKIIPKFGAGIYYHQAKWFAGFSIPTLIASDNEYDFSANINKSSNLRKHYYLTGGYVFDLNDKLKLKPSTLIKYVKSAPVEVDINCSILYDETIWFGISYRTNDAIVGIIEYQANKKFRIGYSYDFTISEIGNYSSGSHEIMIGYDFAKDLVNIKTPRFF
jgi:type IX secretion system PorP/SprF family membrane protein